MTKLSTLLVFALTLLFVGCTAEGPEGGAGTADPATPSAAQPEGGMAADVAAITAKLAAADALDGATDQVVGKCASCALGMDGKADHALEVEGYQMHFCSGHCRDGFETDVKAKVLAMNIPAK
ncbi:MAG: hypothetical protein AAF628_09205 [Planctomycetota bacterium]